MHELGHNLGLRHGGDENLNYKPNYLSVMNYLYQLNGLPTIGDQEEDRYHYEYGYILLSSMLHNASANQVDFIMDYSDGSSGALNESSLNEAGGLGRASSAAVDFNMDGDNSDSGLSLNLTAPYGDSDLSALSDHNDWSNINLFFMRQFNGNMSGISLSSASEAELFPDPVGNDRQEIATEPPIRIPQWQ